MLAGFCAAAGCGEGVAGAGVDGGETFDPRGSKADSGEASSVGGGAGYARRIDPDASGAEVVRDLDGLAAALEEVGEGDIVYVADGARIDFGRTQLEIPAGVVLASGRGRDGSEGGLLYTTEFNNITLLTAPGGDVRITGLRLGGPNPWGRLEVDNVYDYDVLGVELQGDVRSEIDNCEIFGFTVAGVRVAGPAVIQNNFIHHNAMEGLGYGVTVANDQTPVIQRNRFDYNRHAIATRGGTRSGYVARYNHFGARGISHVLDAHEPGGGELNIHHNTFETAMNPARVGSRESAVVIRGVPDNARIHKNWFKGYEPVRAHNEGAGAAIKQVDIGDPDGDFRQISIWDNHFGGAPPSDPGIGAPR